jgi:hypothetical protein
MKISQIATVVMVAGALVRSTGNVLAADAAGSTGKLDGISSARELRGPSAVEAGSKPGVASGSN